jgi:hypothetical protein
MKIALILRILALICVLAGLQSAPALAVESRTQPWFRWSDTETPVSRPHGQYFVVTFINRYHMPVKIYWLSPDGQRTYYYEIVPGASRPQKVRDGAVWIATDAQDESLGYFVIKESIKQAVIPHNE